MSTVIGLREVRKEFGDVTAAEEINLEISEGEFFTILGPSGSGKTTVLRMIAGLETVTQGTIHLGDTDVTNTPPYNRDVNTVFQDYALFPHMTVSENIGYGLRIRGEDQTTINQRINDLLELVSLSGLEDRPIDELSGGQQQRVALARALAIEPRVLLLDEPLGALDEKLRREMQIELKEIQEQLGTTFVYVTHDQEEALSMSDRLAVMDSGKIIQTGSPETVYEQPRTPFIARFFRGSNIYEANIQNTNEPITLEALNTKILATPPNFDLPENKPVQFFIRSENIHLGDDDNTVTGEIKNTVYRGELTDYTIRLNTGEQIVATLASADHTENQEITLGWNKSDTIILHPDAE